MMKQFLKVTFVFELCLRLVLFASFVSAGGSYNPPEPIDYSAAMQAVAEASDYLEKEICCTALENYETRLDECAERTTAWVRLACFFSRETKLKRKDVMRECDVGPNSDDGSYDELRDSCDDDNDSCEGIMCVRDRTLLNIIRNIRI